MAYRRPGSGQFLRLPGDEDELRPGRIKVAVDDIVDLLDGQPRQAGADIFQEGRMPNHCESIA